IRNSIGFTWDRGTGRLWETENGPECNDEVNLIRKGRNYGWGPNQDCSSGSSPTNTNNSGPTPRILPKHTFVGVIGITGGAFCRGCGIGPSFNGDLLVGAVNDGVIRRFDLNATRTGFDRGPTVVLDRPGPVLSMEVGPNGRIFFSDFGAIYRLAPA
ncbi:MAG TPA: PQQ-dependent sugar dehydrogenase, partial [Actinomycetota bacterium]|nr:PQQ-dependent sugar dehydrogenase [Actinomycetota bacterium]